MLRFSIILGISLMICVSAAQAAFVEGTFTCTFADDLALVKHAYSFDCTTSTLRLHEGPVYAMGNDWVTISGVTDSDPVFRINEDVTNDTGFTWTGYELTLPAGGLDTFVNDAYTTSDKFSAVSISNYKITFSSGSVADGSDVTFQFKINVPTTGNFNFDLTQTPIPEPATMGLLLIGGAGMLFIHRRRRRV